MGLLETLKQKVKDYGDLDKRVEKIEKQIKLEEAESKLEAVRAKKRKHKNSNQSKEKRYDLGIAYDGFEAGQRFSEFKQDLVILDIRMPGLDGYKLCSHIRSNPENKNVKILFISGMIGQKELKQIKDSGANDYLAKPFDNQTLKIKIEKLLGANKVEDA